MDDAYATDVPLPTEDPPRCFSYTHSYSVVHNHQPNSNDLGSHKSNDDFDNCESSHGRGNLESSDDLDHHESNAHHESNDDLGNVESNDDLGNVESNDDLGNVESNYDLGKLESKDDLQNDKSNDLAGYNESSTGNEEFGDNDFNEFLRYQWEGHFRHNQRNNYPHSHLTNSSLPSKSAIEVRNEQNSLNYTHELPSNQSKRV